MKDRRKSISSNTLKRMAANHLKQRIQLVQAGLASVTPDELVLPHRVLTDALIDPALAWNEAKSEVAGGKKELHPPAGWAGFVSSLGIQSGLPMAPGFFPQVVRSPFHLMENLRAETTLPFSLPLPDLDAWVEGEAKGNARKRIAAGICSLAGDYAQGEKWLKAANENNEALANDWGALHWMRGDWAKARALWAKVKGASGCFNRALGLAKSGEDEAAKIEFTSAADQLSETSGWHHLARLFQFAL